MVHPPFFFFFELLYSISFYFLSPFRLSCPLFFLFLFLFFPSFFLFPLSPPTELNGFQGGSVAVQKPRRLQRTSGLARGRLRLLFLPQPPPFAHDLLLRRRRCNHSRLPSTALVLLLGHDRPRRACLTFAHPICCPLFLFFPLWILLSLFFSLFSLNFLFFSFSFFFFLIISLIHFGLFPFFLFLFFTFSLTSFPYPKLTALLDFPLPNFHPNPSNFHRPTSLVRITIFSWSPPVSLGLSSVAVPSLPFDAFLYIHLRLCFPPPFPPPSITTSSLVLLFPCFPPLRGYVDELNDFLTPATSPLLFSFSIFMTHYFARYCFSVSCQFARMRLLTRS